MGVPSKAGWDADSAHHLTSRASVPQCRVEPDPPAEARDVCAECGRQPRAADENAADEWRAYLDVSGRAVVILTGCQLLVTVC